MGERLHKVLGQIDLGTLDAGEQSLPFRLLVFRFTEVELKDLFRPDMTEKLLTGMLSLNTNKSKTCF